MITSATNNFIKLAASLHHKKGRQEHNLYLVEGIHLVWEAIRAQVPIKYFFWAGRLTTSMEGSNLLATLQAGYEGYEVTETLLTKICETEHPQGVIALIPVPSEPNLDLTNVKLGLVLDRLQDPGNVGTIIRTAWAAAINSIFLTTGTADPYQGKVIRGSMGGIFQVKLFNNLTAELISKAALNAKLQIIAGEAEAELNYYECDLTPPTLIIIGNEGQGLSLEWERFPILKVAIPQPGQAESLNAAVSAGILIYETIRQRSIRKACKS